MEYDIYFCINNQIKQFREALWSFKRNCNIFHESENCAKNLNRAIKTFHCPFSDVSKYTYNAMSRYDWIKEEGKDCFQVIKEKQKKLMQFL